MRTDLSVRARHLGEMRVDVDVRGHVLPMDYPVVEGGEPTPLEVLLASLAACAANVLNLVLCSKMGAKVTSLEVEAKGQRREEHPTIFTHIELVYHLRGDGLAPELVDRALHIAEVQLCPILAMLRPGVEISTSWLMD